MKTIEKKRMYYGEAMNVANQTDYALTSKVITIETAGLMAIADFKQQVSITIKEYSNKSISDPSIMNVLEGMERFLDKIVGDVSSPQKAYADLFAEQEREDVNDEV